MKGYQPRGVLAGAYGNGWTKAPALNATRTHWYKPGESHTLCGKIPEAHLADEYSPVGEVDCPACVQRMARRKSRGPVVDSYGSAATINEIRDALKRQSK